MLSGPARISLTEPVPADLPFGVAPYDGAPTEDVEPYNFPESLPNTHREKVSCLTREAFRSLVKPDSESSFPIQTGKRD